MFKMIGAALIVGASGYTGMQKASQLSQRTTCLRQLRMDIDFLEKEIDYMRSPLAVALEKTSRVSSNPVKCLFVESSRTLALQRSCSAKEAWKAGMEALEMVSPLSSEDLSIIRVIGERLGTSNVADQVKMLRMASEELKVQETKARDREVSEKKMWSYGGFLLGLLICILML
ncbi:MAG: hypothetical protein ACM3PP_10510 [Candidatus Saccharibacteria bacterium]